MKYIKKLASTAWGILFIISGVLSIILDLYLSGLLIESEYGDSIPVFTQGSAILGWLGVLIFIIMPALVVRVLLKRNIFPLFAILLCAACGFLWLCVKAVLLEGDLTRSGLSFIAGLITCYRLLDWEEEKFESGAGKKND
jgi:hypothetical protein